MRSDTVRNVIEIAVLYCRETLPFRNKFHSSELLRWLIASGASNAAIRHIPNGQNDSRRMSTVP
jgi:hypothetical protein